MTGNFFGDIKKLTEGGTTGLPSSACGCAFRRTFAQPKSPLSKLGVRRSSPGFLARDYRYHSLDVEGESVNLMDYPARGDCKCRFPAGESDVAKQDG